MRVLNLSSPYYCPDQNSDSILLTDENFLDFFYDTTKKKFHTSLGDISSHNLLNFCSTVNKVVFIDEQFDNLELFNKTIIFLNSVTNICQVTNYDRPNPYSALLPTLTPHKSSQPTLWIFGCSLSHGVGVLPEEVYHYDLGRKLNLPVSAITQGGSSTRWSLLQLMHTNIKPTDIVIWQVTGAGRFTVKNSKDELPRELLLKHREKEFLMYANREQIFYDHITLVDYGVNYLRAVNAKFAIFGATTEFNEDRCLEQYTRYPEFCYTPNWMVDIGSDQEHPGPLSHEIVTNSLYKKLIVS